MQIILASQSLARKKILVSLGLSFKAVPSNIDESQFTDSNPITLAQKIAKAKVQKVTEQLINLPAGKAGRTTEQLIIAADSMVVLNNEAIGKPRDKREAKKILKELSGKTHQFITGVFVINTKTKKIWQEYTESKVTFRKLKDWETDAYLKRTDPTLYAGGYSLDRPQDFITKVEGSITNVLGLPLEVLLPILRENGFKI